MDPIPFEQEFPAVAEEIRQIANREHPVVRSYNRNFMSHTFTLHTGQKIRFETGNGRNSPCPCGSKRKFKKCCIIWY